MFRKLLRLVSELIRKEVHVVCRILDLSYHASDTVLVGSGDESKFIH
jgi:hypothetical protein